MRFVSIAMFFLCIHLAIVLVNLSGIYDVSLQANNAVVGAVTSTTINDASYSQSQVQASQNFGFGDFVKAIFFFVTGFAVIVFAFPVTLVQFGIPVAIAVVLSAPIYFIYLFALAQLLGNRSEKVMG